MKNQLIQAIKEVGQQVLKFYGDKEDFLTKSDNSPVTKADQISHDYLTTALPQIKNVSVLSEENYVDYNVRRGWKEFWLIDPLDGTKEFINGYGDFCINIALIKNKKPVVGIIYAPAFDELYYAESGCGFEYQGLSYKRMHHEETIVATSRFHHSELTKKFMELNQLEKTYTMGAAIKFGRMALGHIDLYPRFEESKEWDTAAGQIILEESGCSIVDLLTGQKPKYNKPDIKNNFFVAHRSSLELNQFKLPEPS